MFRSHSPGRSSSAPRRLSGHRPHLEALEDRLPPRDTLGWLLGGAWLAADVAASDLTSSAGRCAAALPQPGNSLAPIADGLLTASVLFPAGPAASVSAHPAPTGADGEAATPFRRSSPWQEVDDFWLAPLVAARPPLHPDGADSP